jgi:hypothetical protein
MTEPAKDTRKIEPLPAEYRAEVLKNQSNIYFNVALFEQVYRVAQMFANSTMVPDHFRGNAGNCMIALNYAHRLGADEFMTFQSLYVVHGRPGVEAKLVQSAINSSGKYKDPLEYQWLDPNDNEVPRTAVLKAQIPSEYGCQAFAVDSKTGKRITGPKITWAIVKNEGWYDRKGTDGTVQSNKWRTMPEMMFYYRAASWFANKNCPEVKLGMATVEELHDSIELVSSNGKTFSMPETPEDLTKRIHESAKEKEEKPGEDPIREEIPEPDRDLYDGLKNVRSATLETRVLELKNQILATSPEFQNWLENTKWPNVYKDGRPYPFPKQENPATGQIATPSTVNEPEQETPEPKTIGDRVYDVQCNNPEIAMDYTYREFCETRCQYKDRKDGSVCEDYMNYLKAKGEA